MFYFGRTGRPAKVHSVRESPICGTECASRVGWYRREGFPVQTGYTKKFEYFPENSGCVPIGATTTGANSFAEENLIPAFVAEFVFTFIFVLVVLRTTDQDKGAGQFAGLAIGLTLVLVHIVCIPITGTSVNPARSIGPALFEGGAALSQLWLFIVAPMAGAALAALASRK